MIYVITMTCTTLFPNAGYWVLYIFEAYYLVKPTSSPRFFKTYGASTFKVLLGSNVFTLAKQQPLYTIIKLIVNNRLRWQSECGIRIHILI